MQTQTVHLCCPICGESLESNATSYFCLSGHSFDRARSGYVNLLRRQSHRVRGDDGAMVRARRAFLEENWYRPLFDRLVELVLPTCPQEPIVYDVGCGEGWYACQFAQAVASMGKQPHLVGFDISPDALKYAANRAKSMQLQDAQWVAASMNHLPVAATSGDILFNIFAPCDASEFARVLRPDGRLIRVIPLARHLWQIKELVYAHPYENRPILAAPDGFQLVDCQSLEKTITLSGQSLCNLFDMTPYVRKTSPKDREKMQAIAALTTEIAFGILVCRPHP